MMDTRSGQVMVFAITNGAVFLLMYLSFFLDVAGAQHLLKFIVIALTVMNLLILMVIRDEPEWVRQAAMSSAAAGQKIAFFIPEALVWCVDLTMVGVFVWNAWIFFGVVQLVQTILYSAIRSHVEEAMVEALKNS